VGTKRNNKLKTYIKMSRLEILKTYKIFIGGAFPRTESGRFYPLLNKDGVILANMCLSSRKDFRNAVTAARGAQAGWGMRAHFNRSQILYRIAEMLEGRRSQFEQELQLQGSTPKDATTEVSTAIDRLVYYAGWADKYQQLFSTVNPVASSHFNFSVCEPTGVVSIVADENTSLLGLVSAIAPIITGGNTVVVLASETKPLCAVTLAEVINTSDVPAGVVNILTGKAEELIPHMSSHMDVNAIIYCNTNAKHIKLMQENASLNVKRVVLWNKINWLTAAAENPYMILDAQEVKTTWHPIENIGGGAKAGY
jgi:acyl-CoA reductase-like NAD-dependent aldehyde dehydrogenase